MEIINMTEYGNKSQGQEIRAYEPLKEVSAFVDEVRLSAYGMELVLGHLAGVCVTSAPSKMLKTVETGLSALERSDEAETALWKISQEMIIWQNLPGAGEENLQLFRQAFQTIERMREAVHGYRAAIRSVMTSQESAEALSTARRKVAMLMGELPGILEAVSQIEM